MSVPQFSTRAVKAFAKTLRSRITEENGLESLPSDLVAQLACDGPLGFPTNTSFIENRALVTCILAMPGCGKTTLAVVAAAIGKFKPRQRVIFLSPYSRRDFEPAAKSSPLTPSPVHVLEPLGFDLVSPDRLETSLKGNESIVVYDGKPSDLDVILDSQPSDTLVITDDLFLKTHDYDLSGSATAAHHHIDRSMRIARKLTNVQLLFCEQSDLVLDDALIDNGYMAVMRLTHWEMSYHHGASSQTFKMMKVPREKPLLDTVLTLTKSRLPDRAKIERRIKNFIDGDVELLTHTASLEATAKILGFSSWHALQGREKNAEMSETVSQPPTITAFADLIERHNPDADQLWMGRTLTTVEALWSAQIDVREPNLLEAMMEQAENPDIARYLDSLPGYPKDLDTARKMLGFSSLMAVKALEIEYGTS